MYVSDMADTSTLADLDWHFADLWEAMAAAIPDRTAIIYGDQVVDWKSFDQRSNALAQDLLDAGLRPQAKVAVYVPNRPEYLEAYHAAQKISAWPFNVNYRYAPDEILYLLDNADAEAVVFDIRFVETVDALRDRAANVVRWYAVGDDCPEWAVPYESVASAQRDEPPRGRVGRSGDDVILTYTGGTTGMPKGVMWQHRALFPVTGAGGSVARGIDPPGSLEAATAAAIDRAEVPIVLLACPLMHATALASAYGTLSLGGTIVLLPGDRFDAAGLWDTVDRTKADQLVIVGDAFARPLVDELEASPGRWSLATLKIVYSAGVMWSQDIKERMFEYLRDDALMLDVFGSSEAAGMGSSISTKGAVAQTASFMVGPMAQVISESGGFVVPGSGEVGLAAFGGPTPVGYYKDEKKSAETFRTIEGRRWAVPGDFATVEVDGTLKLLGRGSVCINTGGEKVFVEEVEEVLKEHDAVNDAVCVGIPHERFGETVCAVVELKNAGVELDTDGLVKHVKTKLAGYKAPRDVIVVPTIGRAANGKVDYKGLREHARTELGR